MSDFDQLWKGLSKPAREALQSRDYAEGDLATRLRDAGVDASELLRERERLRQDWIPGVEVFARKIFPQRHRGFFGELVRRDEGPLARIGLWPVQWAAARMFVDRAKGFHIHPPHIPDGLEPAAWLKRLYLDEPENYALRPYDREQWDVMFFVQGRVEVILREARAALPSRTMRLFVDGDDHRGANNVGIVIPAGVAHALRAEAGTDVIMIYGTSTIFHPEFEGRIGSGIETAELPSEWNEFLKE